MTANFSDPASPWPAPMSDVFISYARSTAAQATKVAEALRSLGYSVWIDEDLPAHRTYSRVIEEQMSAAKAAVVIWSADAVQSEWVLSEANRAREDRKLVQVTTDTARLPMPFDTIQCAELAGWTGDADAPGWRKVVASIAELVDGGAGARAPAAITPPALPLPSKPSIAVLPFANRSGDAEQDYFADGMVEEIVAALSRFKSIFVIGSGSSLSFKGKATTPQEAAGILGVRYILEGSVRKAGGRVRIAVELIDAADGAQIWSDRFEDTLEDVFALQDRVALSVAGVIGPAVRNAEERRASARSTENMNSHDLCLRGMSVYRSVLKADVLAALDLFNAATVLDPNYGWPLALAANCHAFTVLFGWSDDAARHIREAQDLGQRALAAARDDPEVLAYVANAMLMLGGDPEAFATLADRALVLNPGSSLVWGCSGWVRMSAGEPELAFEHFETALRLDPLSADRHFNLGGLGAARFAQGRFAEAITFLKQSAQLKPGWAFTHAHLAAGYGHLGDASAARQAIARYRSLTPVDIRDWAVVWSIPHLQRQLLLDGIALAEGNSPADATA